MTIKRLFLTLLVALLLPGFAYAQTVTRATFEVTKDFTDNNTKAVANITLNCNDGLPVKEDQNFSDNEKITFVVTNFTSGSMDCIVEEAPIAGYSSDLPDSTVGDNDSCKWTNVTTGSAKTGCVVKNSPDLVELEICKEWVVDNASGGGSEVDQGFELRLTCDNPVYATNTTGYGDYQGNWWVDFSGKGEYCGAKAFTADVLPDWNSNPVKGVVKGTKCSVSEVWADSSVEPDTSDCKDLYFAIGSDDQECTVVNTVFYEGIPTLSQYGMAIMALLMLGVGFVGFRRFV